MKHLKKWLVVLAALFVLTGMMSCDMFSEEDEVLEIIGEWDNGMGIGISERTFTSSYGDTVYYTATIVDFDNSGFNAGESGEGDCGYLVMQFDYAPSWYADNADLFTGKYTVFRWQNITTANGETTMETSEGSNDPTFGDGMPGTYYDTREEAIENVTEANGYFSSGYGTTAKITE